VPAGKVIDIMGDAVLTGDPSKQAGQGGSVAAEGPAPAVAGRLLDIGPARRWSLIWACAISGSAPAVYMV
jgi:hypothetical protein